MDSASTLVTRPVRVTAERRMQDHMRLAQAGLDEGTGKDRGSPSQWSTRSAGRPLCPSPNVAVAALCAPDVYVPQDRALNVSFGESHHPPPGRTRANEGSSESFGSGVTPGHQTPIA